MQLRDTSMPQAVNHKSRICEVERRDKAFEPLTDRIAIAVIPTPASRVRELQFDSWSYAYHVVSMFGTVASSGPSIARNDMALRRVPYSE
jgi:hypothetical protein